MKKETNSDSPIANIQRLAADVFFYAPIGHFAKRASDIKVELVNKTNEIENSALSAKAIGKFSFAFAKTKASQQIAAFTARLYGSKEHLQANHGQDGIGTLSSNSLFSPDTGDLMGTQHKEKVVEDKSQLRKTESSPTNDQHVDEQNGFEIQAQSQDIILPIRGYTTLAASQIIERLGSLTQDELDAVYKYELGHRQRRTIMTKIVSLKNQSANA